MRVTLTALAAPASRLTSRPDLAPGDAVEWDDSGVKVYPDGSFSVANTVKSFRFRVRDKRRWGSWATVEIK